MVKSIRPSGGKAKCRRFQVQAGDEIDPLTRLAIRHGTDKWGPHFYTPVYHELVRFPRPTDVLLEIGVGGYDVKTLGGNSLAMWAEYFAKGEITGIDKAEKRLDLHPRVKIFHGRQEDPAFLKKVCDARGPFDIVIDDGSHIADHIVASFNALFPAAAAGGLYVIEDTQTGYSGAGLAAHGTTAQAP